MFFTFIFWIIGCQSDDELESTSDNAAITNSTELEEFIIAASDLQQSLIVFEKELLKVKLSDVETEVNADGSKVIYLPAVIGSLNIEQKILLVNQKKQALYDKYPQLASMRREEIVKIIDCCVNNSVRVSTFFDEKNINIHLRTTRSFFNESYSDMNELIGHIYNWTLSPDYVEVNILAFSDGTYAVVQTEGSTAHETSIELTVVNNTYYYAGKQVVAIAHTHRDSSNPSQTDLDSRLPYCENYIYYNGAFHSF